MVDQYKLVLDEVAFVSDINPMDLPPGPLEGLNFGIQGQTGTTAVVKALTGLKTVSLFRVFLNGLKTEISGNDLLAYNALVLGNIPKTYDSGSSSANPWALTGLIVPLGIASGLKAQIQLVWITQTNATVGKVAIFAKVAANPGAGMYGLQRRPITPTTTGSYGNKTSLSMKGAKLLGIIIYSTTVPTTTAVLVSAHKIRLSGANIPDQEVNWFTLPCSGQVVTGNTDIDAVLTNYRYWAFDESLDATDITADIYADDTNAVVLIPIYQFATP
jgi:hypothetical protein